MQRPVFIFEQFIAVSEHLEPSFSTGKPCSAFLFRYLHESRFGMKSAFLDCTFLTLGELSPALLHLFKKELGPCVNSDKQVLVFAWE